MAIAYADLNALVWEIVGQSSPFSGIRIIQGQMEDRGVLVQRESVRAALHHVDGLNMRARLRLRLLNKHCKWYVAVQSRKLKLHIC